MADNLTSDMAGGNQERPSWVPKWFPSKDSVTYGAMLIQLFVLSLAAGFFIYYMSRKKVDAAAGILGARI